MTTRSLLLAGATFFVCAAAANAQDSSAPPSPADRQTQQDQPGASATLPEYEDEGDGQTIVVTGAKPRGSVIGNIPPESTLTSRDIQATGANDITELLEAIAPQVGSAQGRGGERPVMLLNGQRVSSFRELRDIPTEAISRLEILPEEVALKYGYPANQKVVNIVLRSRFRSTNALLSGKAATEGGYPATAADVTRLMIGEKGRTTVNLHAEGNGMLTEDERDILLGETPPAGADESDLLAARSLIGTKRDLRASVTVNRELGAVGATGNAEVEHVEGRSLIGLGETLLTPLARNTSTDSAHAGMVLNGSAGDWHWSVTGNADAQRDVTKTDVDAEDERNRTRTTTLSGDVDAMANGKFFELPAGDAEATFHVGASTLHLDGDSDRGPIETSSSLGRTTGNATVNVDLPVSRRNSDFGSVGNLSINANGAVEQLSDFGTLTTVGAGANWSPVKRLNLITSWTREEGAPSVHQLGDPLLQTPGTRIFDFTTGDTVLVTAITGGNPNLEADSRTVLKLGGNWQPLENTDLRFRADYVRSTIDGPISNFPGPTAELEAAFPERFVRDPDGNLVAVDLRPVNYDKSKRDTLRLGFDFSKPLKSAAPSQAAIAAFRLRREASGQGRGSGDDNPPSSSEGSETGSPTGVRGGGRFGGRRNGGRLTFSLADTITLVDEVTIRDDLKLDYLHGDALGQAGGRPRHEVEARAGYFNNGLGARLSADWRSGTEVNTSTGDDLRFSPLATFDLRLFANLGQRFDLVARHPWLRGSSVRFEVDNIFDSKPKVRDAFGSVPLNYQPDLLDPLGRTITITFRKLFLPPPSFFRREASGGGEE